MRKVKFRDKLIEHLMQPFSVPYPGRDRTYFSSGFCESDEVTTIYKRSVIEGDSDVCSVECSLCGDPVITHKHSSQLTSTLTPEIVGCLIQKDKTLCFVVEIDLSPSDLKMTEDVILAYLARHDFTASFQQISVYHSGVNSALMKKLPPKRNLLFTQKLKSISEGTLEDIHEKESLALGLKDAQDKGDKRRRKEMAGSAKKLLKELQKLSTLPDNEKSETSSNQQQNFQKTLKHSSERLSKEEKTSLRLWTTQLATVVTVYD